MNNKTGSWLLIFFLTMSIFSSMFVSIPNNNVAVADTQTWENEYGKLEVEPATSRNLIHQKQWYNLTWYYPSNSIDIAFGFNESLSYGQIYYWDGDSYNKVSTDHIEYNGQHFYIVSNINVGQDETKHGYWEYDTPINSNGKWDMYAKLSSDSWSTAFSTGRIIHLDPWWDSDWDKRKDLFIDHDQVNDTLPNFPVLVNISDDTDMFGNVQNNLGDIVFVNTLNDTVFPHEIEWFEIGPSPSTISALIFVKIDSVSHTVDTHFNMYYGNANCVSQQDPTNVWDAHFHAIYHMNSTGGTSCNDSKNGYTATLNGNLQNNTADGIVGLGLSFDGDNDYITFPDGSWLTTGNDFGTHEVYVRPNGTANYQLIQQRDDATGGLDQMYMRLTSSGGYRASGHSAGTEEWYIDTTGSTDVGYWTYTAHAMAQYDTIMWVDGKRIWQSLDASAMPNQAVAQKLWHGFGVDHVSANDFDGYADEIRISSTRRNNSWLMTTYNTMHNQTTFVTFGAEIEGPDIVPSVTGFNATTNNPTTITLNWTQSTNGNYTYVERNTITVWSRGSGTFVYNATGINTTDSNLSRSNIYYYQAWAFNESQHNFSGYESINNHTGPTIPTNIITSIISNDLKFTWTKGTRASSTVIVRKTDSEPTGINDGTQIYNGTAAEYTDTTFTETNYYKVFAFNTSVGIQSTGVAVPWGALQVQVYDENTSEAIYNYTVFITNASGTETYEIYSANTSTINIDINDLPTGADVVVSINASVYVNATVTTEYKDRIYIMDIYPNTYYNLTAYLSRVVDVESYVVRVIDDYDNSVEDAKIKFQRYINASVGYKAVGIYHTDANGYVTIDLIPGEKYLLEISKTGFDTVTPFMYPLEIVYIEDRYHIFKILYTTIDPDVVTFNTVILFCSETGWITSNDTLHISFFDKLSETSDITIHVYESYETNLSFNHSYSYTDTYDIDIWVTGLNTSCMHRIKIVSMNHTTLGRIENKSCDIMPIHLDDDAVTETALEDAFRDVGGDFSMGYVNMFILFVPSFAILIGLGYVDPGFGILVAGMYFILCSWHIDLVDAATIAVLISMLIPLGIIVIVGKRGKKIT